VQDKQYALYQDAAYTSMFLLLLPGGKATSKLPPRPRSHCRAGGATPCRGSPSPRGGGRWGDTGRTAVRPYGSFGGTRGKSKVGFATTLIPNAGKARVYEIDQNPQKSLQSSVALVCYNIMHGRTRNCIP
jgi:hypothetical protein